jgi:NAD(P)-dependent dehydrogenase (short-subunit alcohol dehydrogenase family)
MSNMAQIIAQFQSIPLPQKSFKAQTVIITGSNTGLGFEAAKHITRLEASRVILAVRSPKKGDAAKSAIESATGRQGVVEVWPLEMDDFSSIKDFAARCETLDRLDVVIANAGVLKTEFEESDGIEMTIKVNVIGTFLLALSLFPILRRSAERTAEIPRLVVTSSVRHKSVRNFPLKPIRAPLLIDRSQAKFSERNNSEIFKALNSKASSNMLDRYDTSKLLELMLVASINEAMEKGPNAGKPIILNCVNPGLCKSELDRDVKVRWQLSRNQYFLEICLCSLFANTPVQGVFAAIYAVVKALLARTTEVGGRTLVHAASSGEESRGKYLSECRVAKPGGLVQSKEEQALSKRLHAELITILEKIQPGVTKNI